jgi:agmatinase
MEFDPSGVSVRNGKYYGLPSYSPEEADLCVLAVPWDVTTSYRAGTSQGPAAILEASYQVDIFSPYCEDAWKARIGTLPVSHEWLEKNAQFRKASSRYIDFLGEGGSIEDSAEMRMVLGELNRACERLHLWVEEECSKLLQNGRKVVLVGGEHSVSYGLIKALSENDRFGILHIDAHADLRDAYEGFEHSHASIMRNALKLPNVESLTQVGIRDVSPAEIEFIESQKSRVHTFFDWDLKRALADGCTWKENCNRIIETLPEKVYVSFDIDGLDPKLCPSTGTPVPGGLEYDQALYLLDTLTKSGRKIVGADLVEVAPGQDNEWDGNVGARLLFNLCLFVLK